MGLDMVRGLSWVMGSCAAVLLLAYGVDVNGPTPRWHVGLRQTIAAVFFGTIPLWLGALATRDGRVGPRLWRWSFAVVWAAVVLSIAGTFALTAGAPLESLQFHAQGADGGLNQAQQFLLLFKPSPTTVILWSALLSIVALLSWTEDPARPRAGLIRTGIALACVLPCAAVAYADDAAGFWMLAPPMAPGSLRTLALGAAFFATLLTFAAVLGTLRWSRGAHFLVGLIGAMLIGIITVTTSVAVDPSPVPTAIWPTLTAALLWTLLAFLLGGALHQTQARLPAWSVLVHAVVFGLVMLMSVAPNLYLALAPFPEGLPIEEMQRRLMLGNDLSELAATAGMILPVLFAIGLLAAVLRRSKAPAP